MSYGLFTQIAEITDHLYLSSAAAITPERIRSLGITNIINCTMDIPNLNLPEVESLQIHIDDSAKAYLSVYFDRVGEKIHQVAGRGGKTLVHCVAGVSRSATLCIAYLMAYYAMSLEKAHAHVKAKRSVIYPNVGFWRQLIDYERRIFGRNSVKMVSSGVGAVPDVYSERVRGMVWYPTATSHRPPVSSRVSRYRTY